MAKQYTFAFTACAILWATSAASAQIGWSGYGYSNGYGIGGRTGWIAPSPWMMGGRAGLYGGYGGIGGPRAVTWYTPGQGYSSNVQTGLPWNQGGVGRSARGLPPSAMDDASSIAREERAARRMDTLLALKDYERERRREIYRTETMLAASAKKKEAGKGIAKKSTKSKRPTPPLLSEIDDQPSQTVPYEKRPTSTPEVQPTVTSPASATQKEAK
ncbi:hypothetical protein K2X85_10680 [bacterium]|jgi:hypothetical protein|nr:hypothetical protein [bacterium]